MLNDKLKNILIIILAVLALGGGAFGTYFFLKTKAVVQRETEARVSAQNTIAQLSRTVKEGERTWSRLAQEKEIEISGLNEDLEDALSRIRERDERITTLTEVNAALRGVRVIVRPDNVHQSPEPSEPGEAERVRVEFDQVWEDFMRVSGFTLTNPAEAEIHVDYTRPVRISVITTQRPDLSWDTYVSTDIPNLEIGDIQSQVNPLSRPQEVSRWYENIYVGIGAGIGGGTNAAGFGLIEIGYDFGDMEIGIFGTGIGYDGGASFGGGFTFRLNPFAL